MIYGDTSFWVSLYVEDAHSAQAVELLRENKRSILWNDFCELEFLTALARCCRIRSMSEDLRRQILSRHQRAMKDQLGVTIRQPDWGAAMQRGCALANSVILTLAGRSLDILHVGIALELKVPEFWTFDKNQAAVAESQGLRVRGV